MDYRWVVGLLGGRPPVGVLGGSVDDVRPKWWCWTLRYGVRGTTGKAGVTGLLSKSPLIDEFQDMALSYQSKNLIKDRKCRIRISGHQKPTKRMP